MVLTRKIGGRGGRRDRFAADVKFLAVFQGPSGAADGVVDLTGRHVRTVNNAAMSTSVKTLGASSLALVAASSSYASFPDSADWNTTAAGLTIEATIRRDGTPGGSAFFCIAEQDDSTIRPWGLFINEYGHLGASLSSNGSTSDISTADTNRGAVADTTWTHVAMVHDAVADQYRFYVDGTLTSTISSSANLHDGDGAMQIGRAGTGSYFNGHINALRITAAARYDAAFEPPTLAQYLASLTS